MTIHFFTFSDINGGSSRQRAYRIAEELEKRGWRTVVHRPPVVDISRTRWPRKALLLWRMLCAISTIRRGDIVYLHRAVANKYFVAAMALYLVCTRRRMIFDFDDPIYVHSYAKTKLFTRMADVVVVCTHGQAAWARQFNPNVHIVHIALNASQYAQYSHSYGEPGPRTIGWVGHGPEHLDNLRLLAEVLRRLPKATRVPFRFELVGALGDPNVYELFNALPGVPTTFVDSLDWSDPFAVPKRIQTFDIGVLPHRNDGEWHKSKSSFKILEYMACGVASVVSDFGEMPYVVEDGVTGFRAADTEAWVAALVKLLEDRELRARLGQAGQERVAREFSFDAVVPRIEALLRSLGGAPSR